MGKVLMRNLANRYQAHAQNYTLTLFISWKPWFFFSVFFFSLKAERLKALLYLSMYKVPTHAMNVHILEYSNSLHWAKGHQDHQVWCLSVYMLWLARSRTWFQSHRERWIGSKTHREESYHNSHKWKAKMLQAEISKTPFRGMMVLKDGRCKSSNWRKAFHGITALLLVISVTLIRAVLKLLWEVVLTFESKHKHFATWTKSIKQYLLSLIIFRKYSIHHRETTSARH